MEHFVTFLLLVALLSSVVAITITLMLHRQFHHRSSPWFAVLVAGIGCFVMEILIYRYVFAIRGTTEQNSGILTFSTVWALAGGVLLTLAMPRFARLMTGLPQNAAWRSIGIGLPAITGLAGLGLLCNLGRSILIMQGLIFGSVIIGAVFIAVVRRERPGTGQTTLLRRMMIWSALCLPLVILDALGGLLPSGLKNLPMAVFVPGVCLIAIFEIPKMFGTPPFLVAGQPSPHFLQSFGISSREAEVVALVVQGITNAEIAERLFISGKTIENHLTSIFRKTGAKNRIQLYRLINSSSD